MISYRINFKGLLLILFIGFSINNLFAQKAPFHREDILTNLDQPVAFTFLPDNRMLIAEKGGKILITSNINSLPITTSTYMEITDIESSQERGLLDIVLDPDFAINSQFYVYYTKNSTGKFRISKFTHLGNSGDINHEVVIWEDNEQYQGRYHYAGSLNFGKDGKLYLSTGDQEQSTDPQSLKNAHGKVIRINKDGSIPKDNPFYNAPGDTLQEIWAYGLRNPFRGRIDPETGNFFLGEVGGNDTTAYEDLNLIKKGGNYGYPYCEGPGRDPDGNCYNSNYVDPIYSYARDTEACIIGGIVYRGNQFPSYYKGKLFYADYSRQYMRYLTFDSAYTEVQADSPFIDVAGRVVDIKEGPDGALYFMRLEQNGKLTRVSWYGNQAPQITQLVADSTIADVAPFTVNFTGNATDAENDSLTYIWFFGDNTSTDTGKTVSHTFTKKGIFHVQLLVKDSLHGSISDPLDITVGKKPVINIQFPIDSSFFVAGDTIFFKGIAHDPDGPDSLLTYKWTVVFNHNNHTHPVIDALYDTSGYFTIEREGHSYSEKTGYTLYLTVSDSTGIETTKYVKIFPDKVDVTYNSDPEGLVVIIDGVPFSTPFTLDQLKGFKHEVSVESPRCIDSLQYEFQKWSDNGAGIHYFTVPQNDTELVAEFRETGECSHCIPASMSFDGNDYVSVPKVTVSGDFTFEFWFKSNRYGNTPNQQDGIYCDTIDTTLYFPTASQNIHFYGGKLNYFVKPPGKPGENAIVANQSHNTFGGWEHYAITRKDSLMSLYIDGSLDTTHKTDWLEDFVINAIGLKRTWEPDKRLQGQLDEMRLWNVARSASEISSSYDRTVPINSEGLVAYWSFNHSSNDSQVVNDISLNMHNAIMGSTTDTGSDDPTRVSNAAPIFNDCSQLAIPSVNVLSPVPDTVLYSNLVQVSWTTSGVISGDHIHLTLDSGSHVTIEQQNGSYYFSNVDTGDHVIIIHIANVTHQEYQNPEARDTIRFRVVKNTKPCGYFMAFNGYNKWVNIKDITLSGNFTIEAWVFLNNTGDNEDVIVGEEKTGPSNVMDMNFYNNRLRLFVPGYGDLIVAKTPNEKQKWNHYAITRKGSKLSLYKDGKLDTTTNVLWSGSFKAQSIGKGNESNGLLGYLDEVRIWNTARTAEEIDSFHNQTIQGNAPNLVGYWNFNEDSTSQVVIDYSGNENDGTLGSDTLIASDDAYRENRYHNIEDSLKNDCQTLLPPPPGSGYAIQLDGSYEYIKFDDNSDFDFGDHSFTMELWVKKLETTNNNKNSFALSKWFKGNETKGSNEYALLLSSNGDNDNPAFKFEIDTVTYKLASPDPMTINQWTHLTIVRNVDTFILYMNGEPKDTLVQSGSINNVGRNLEIGVNDANISPGVDAYYTNGQFDEIRIWDTALTKDEIRTWMCRTMKPYHPEYQDLVSYYSFDEAASSQLTDLKGDHDGELHELENSKWVYSGAPIGDTSIYNYNLSTNDSFDLAHTAGDYIRVSDIANNPVGLQMYLINSRPKFHTAPGNIAQLSEDRYWGVFLVEGSSPKFKFKYMYDGHPGIKNEGDLDIAYRDDNSSESWAEKNAQNDTTKHTLTLLNQPSGQFILGTENIQDPLPVELLNFDAYLDGEDVQLTWSTAVEINNSHFIIQRLISLDKQWENIGKVMGQGNSMAQVNYHFKDKDPFIGVNYYRLKQVDFDGSYSYSAIRKVSIADNELSQIEVFPNPFHDNIVIDLNTYFGADLHVILTNSMGEKVFEKSYSGKSSNLTLKLDEKLSDGVYLLSVYSDDVEFHQKVIKE